MTRLGRPYFYAAAARAMRQVLVDAARRRKADKRGAGVPMLSLDEQVASLEAYAQELLELEEGLALRRAEGRRCMTDTLPGAVIQCPGRPDGLQ